MNACLYLAIHHSSDDGSQVHATVVAVVAEATDGGHINDNGGQHCERQHFTFPRALVTALNVL